MDYVWIVSKHTRLEFTEAGSFARLEVYRARDVRNDIDHDPRDYPFPRFYHQSLGSTCVPVHGAASSINESEAAEKVTAFLKGKGETHPIRLAWMSSAIRGSGECFYEETPWQPQPAAL